MAVVFQFVLEAIDADFFSLDDLTRSTFHAFQPLLVVDRFSDALDSAGEEKEGADFPSEQSTIRSNNRNEILTIARYIVQREVEKYSPHLSAGEWTTENLETILASFPKRNLAIPEGIYVPLENGRIHDNMCHIIACDRCGNQGAECGGCGVAPVQKPSEADESTTPSSAFLLYFLFFRLPLFFQSHSRCSKDSKYYIYFAL